jgi:hypothetical protein
LICAVSALQLSSSKHTGSTVAGSQHAKCGPAPALQGAHPSPPCCCSLPAIPAILHCRHTGGTLAGSQHVQRRSVPALQAAHPSLSWCALSALQYCPAGTLGAQWQAASTLSSGPHDCIKGWMLMTNCAFVPFSLLCLSLAGTLAPPQWHTASMLHNTCPAGS